MRSAATFALALATFSLSRAGKSLPRLSVPTSLAWMKASQRSLYAYKTDGPRPPPSSKHRFCPASKPPASWSVTPHCPPRFRPR